jgi:hypothetical protein
MPPADTQLDGDLARLGRSMSPGPSFVDRVMERIESSQPNSATAPGRRWWMPIGLSLAASVILALGSVAIMHNATSPNPGTEDQSANLVRTSTEWQTLSERAILLQGEVPAREISQQKFERVRWVDPRLHTTFERIVPRDKCTFVTLENY